MGREEGRLHSAQEKEVVRKRQEYLDLVLGKLPDIPESQYGRKIKKGSISDRKSEASTAYNTEMSA